MLTSRGSALLSQSDGSAGRAQHPQHPPPLPLLQLFSDDEDLVRDTTAVQLEGGRDIQGIPWELTQYTREGYRVRPRGGLPAEHRDGGRH